MTIKGTTSHSRTFVSDTNGQTTGRGLLPARGARPAPHGRGEDPGVTPNLAVSAGLAALAFCIYVRCADFGFSFLDDKDLIINNQAFLLKPTSALDAFRRLYLNYYYRPLVTVSYVLDAQWSGGTPFGYHFTNVCLHTLCTALIFLIAKELCFSNRPAGLGAALFAVHPALVSTVAWIPGRNDSLFTIFALGSWLLLILDTKHPAIQLRLGHFLSLVAALFTKETAIVLPLFFVCYFWSIGIVARQRAYWLYWLLAIFAFILARSVATVSHPGEGAYHIHSLLHQLPVLIESTGKLCVPFRLSPIATAQDTPIWPGIAAFAAGALLVRVLRPRQPKRLVLGIVLVILPLVPSLFVAERLTLENRLYLPAVGYCIVAAELFDASGTNGVAASLASLLFVAYAIGTWNYAGVYRDRRSFVTAARASSPKSALTHLGMGDFYQEVDNDLDKAELEYRAAIAFDPKEPVVHNDLAVLLMARRKWHDAEVQLREEIIYNHDFGVAYYNLGIVLRMMERPDEAAVQ